MVQRVGTPAALGLAKVEPTDFVLSGGRAQPCSEAISSNGDLFAFSQCTSPDDRHPPSFTQQRSPNDLISCCVGGELAAPEGRARPRGRGISAACVAVPEATVDKNHGSVFWQDNIRPAGQIRRVKSVSEPLCMQLPTKRQLGLRVFSPNPRHHARTGLLVDNVCHLTPILVGRTWYTA